MSTSVISVLSRHNAIGPSNVFVVRSFQPNTFPFSLTESVSVSPGLHLNDVQLSLCQTTSTSPDTSYLSLSGTFRIDHTFLSSTVSVGRSIASYQRVKMSLSGGEKS